MQLCHWGELNSSQRGVNARAGTKAVLCHYQETDKITQQIEIHFLFNTFPFNKQKPTLPHGNRQPIVNINRTHLSGRELDSYFTLNNEIGVKERVVGWELTLTLRRTLPCN